jgi:geranylgeranyl diphosphate synthase type II
MDALAYLRERAPLVDRALDAAIPPAGESPEALHGAMRHLLFPGGKRLRPVLAMAAAEAVGARPESALPAATAVELVHTYSLIHDDLPCMDDDDERRGRPTVHVQFGEATALLAGDALLAAAFGALVGGGGAAAFGALVDSGGPAPERVLGAVRDLAQAAGSLHLVGGQVDDLSIADPSTDGAEEADAERIESVHARKSAALIAASVVSGARLAGADDVTLAQLRAFALTLGVAFQIADDLLDRDEDGACSLARVLGPAEARRRAEALLDTALREIETLDERAEPLRELARFAVRRSE